jgi:hypothetical protein
MELRSRQVLRTVHPIPRDQVPGTTTGIPTLGEWRRVFGDTVLIHDRNTGKLCSASLASFLAFPDETEMGWMFHYSPLPRLLRRLRSQHPARMVRHQPTPLWGASREPELPVLGGTNLLGVCRSTIPEKFSTHRGANNSRTHRAC